MPSYQSIIASKIPDLGLGFDGFTIAENEITGELPYQFSYSDGKTVIVRLAVEIKERSYPKYFISTERVLYSLMHDEEECYVAYYLTTSKRLLVFNVTKCPKTREAMRDIFPNYKGILERYIYIVQEKNSSLDIPINIV